MFKVKKKDTRAIMNVRSYCAEYYLLCALIDLRACNFVHAKTFVGCTLITVRAICSALFWYRNGTLG